MGRIRRFEPGAPATAAWGRNGNLSITILMLHHDPNAQNPVKRGYGFAPRDDGGTRAVSRFNEPKY